MYKNCIYLTRFLSQIDRLVSFQLQIQHGSAIEDLYVYKKRLLSDVRMLRVPSQPIFFTAHFDYPQIVQIIQCYYRGKTISPESLRSIVTDFNFGVVKVLLNVPNISLFLILLILSLARKPVRESPLLVEAG